MATVLNGLTFQRRRQTLHGINQLLDFGSGVWLVFAHPLTPLLFGLMVNKLRAYITIGMTTELQKFIFSRVVFQI